MRMIVKETFIVDIPQTDDFQEAIDIFHVDATDLYDVKHYGYEFFPYGEEEE